MNEELQQAILKMIEGFTASVQGAAGFTVDKAPEVVRQLLEWHFYTSLFWFGLFGSLLILALRYFHRGLKEAPAKALEVTRRRKEAEEKYNSGKMDASWDRYEHYDMKDDMWIIVPAFVCLLCIGPVIGSNTWLKILIAPDLYVLEYAAGLLR